MNPILFAGTWQQYSKKAIIHEKAITRYKGQLDDTPDCCQVPANRIGFVDNGGPFNLVQLKVIQECISLVVFAVIANLIFQHEQLHWNHAAAALCLVAAVYFVFMPNS